MNNRELKETIRMQKFKTIYERFEREVLSCEEAAELLHCSVRHFYRLRTQYEESGFDGLRDRRVGKISPHRAADEEVEYITKLYKERYRGWSVKHFYDFEFSRNADIRSRSYSWVKNCLHSKGLVTPKKKGGAHRIRRPRRPMVGMMIHQDGSRHEWIEGVYWDLIVTMDDATSEIYSAFFVEEEGTNSSFRGIKEVIEQHGLFCSLYTDRGSHYFYTPEAGGKVDKGRPTQVGRALKQLEINHVAAYSPEARGRSERMFGTIQGRLPKELALAKVKTIEEANRYLKERYLPYHNSSFISKPESDDNMFTPILSINIEEILCIQEERTVQNDNTIRYEGKKLQIYKNEYRHHFVKATVTVREYLDGRLGVFHGRLCIGRYDRNGEVLNDWQSAKAA